MSRVFRWIGSVLLGLVVLIAIFLATTYVIANNKLNRSYEVTVPAVAVPTDAASIEEGARLTVARGCTDCHGGDLGGQVMIDDPMMGRVWSANLTTGAGGAGQIFDTEDYARAVWFGVDEEGHALAIMPSNEYHDAFDPAQLGKIIAHLRSAPPVDRDIPDVALRPLGWTLFALGQLPLFPVESMDLSEPPPSDIAIEPTAAYGATIGVLCTGCHGPNLAGAMDPEGVMSANITPDPSGIGSWTYQDFKTALQTGVRPDGTRISEAMPWQNLGQMTDVEFEALWAYLSSIPAVATTASN